jgi:hypothetical protein
MLIRERISVVVSLTLIGLALYFVLEFPTGPATFSLFGTPLTFDSPRQWLMGLLLFCLVMAGADGVIRAHPALPDRSFTYVMTFWMLPGFLLATLTLALAPNLTIWAAGLLLVGLLLWLTLSAEYEQVAPASTASYRLSRLWQQLIGYGMGLVLFILIYQTRSRSALSATGVMLVSGMLALPLLRRSPETIKKSWLFAAVIGLSLGQITWALNYWRAGSRDVGLLLLLIFYVLVGVAQQRLLGTLSRRTILEFGAVAALALVVIFNL